MSAEHPEHIYDAVVVGAGAAGVGIAVTLQHAGINNYLVLERQEVGASFSAWPDETRFITPSFPTNSIGMLDLNAVVIGTSPAWSLQVEHPTGKEFAAHLRGIANYFELAIQENTDVLGITKVGDEFRIRTPDEIIRARHVVWAAGDFQYPNLNGFEGSELCRHTATIDRYADLEGDDFVVIGGYESGVDVAYHLSRRDKSVRLFDHGNPWEDESSDPSVALSTFSLQRVRSSRFTANVELLAETPVTAVMRDGDGYTVRTADDQLFETPVPPLLAGGFEGSHTLIRHLFEMRDDGFPLLSEQDESTIVPGLFLAGAAVRHGNHIFCFIYKYRQRFAVVAKTIATSLGLPAEGLETYRSWGMYLDDLSCCGQDCVC